MGGVEGSGVTIFGVAGLVTTVDVGDFGGVEGGEVTGVVGDDAGGFDSGVEGAEGGAAGCEEVSVVSDAGCRRCVTNQPPTPRITSAKMM